MVKKKLNVKLIKQMCSVPGCANRGSYTMARTRYFGGVNICSDCLHEALSVISLPVSPTLEELLLDERLGEQLKEAIENGIKDGIERASFKNDTSDKEKEDKSDIDNAPVMVQEEQTPLEANKYVCSKCGKVCSTQSGLTNHEKACGGK